MTDWDAVSFVLASKPRFQILLELREKKCTPSELTEKIGVSDARTSTVLKELEEQKLIKCLTPDRRKSKIFTITEKGDEILEEVHELTSKE